MDITELFNEKITVADLSRELGISVQAIYKWEIVPLNRVKDVERITGIPRETLRPDFFGTPPTSAQSSEAA